MENKRKQPFKKPRGQRMTDMSKQDDFLFNRTPILASALQRLKKNEKQVKQKQKPQHHIEEDHQDLQLSGKPSKKVKKSSDSVVPNFAYTPLQKDLYNFYTINKSSLKMVESIPEPKFEVGSTILACICDRGIGGKYLVANLFRNKKGYVDFKEVSQSSAGKDDFSGIESYQQPGDYVICTVVKSISHNHLQLSLSKLFQIDPKSFRVGQVVPAEIRSKQELGCHLQVYKCPKYKFFLPKSSVDDSQYEELHEKKQIIVNFVDIDHSKHLVKVGLASEEHQGFNLRGVEEEEMSKMELEQYVCPGTMVNTKIIKVLKNGVMVKFLKIFIGFIHADHLDNNLDFYSNDAKIQARIIYSCLNPPFIYLSQRHTNLHPYQPKRPLYSAVSKPQNITEIQNSFINKQEEFYVHPTQLHSEMENVSKFWVKENNYFERYQIMTSRKLGLRVGELAKQIPFNNFKIFGDGEEGTKFKVMCLDVWNKVVKVCYDEKVMKSKDMLFDLDEINEGEDKLYCGVIKGINESGVAVQFCNNIRGIIPKNQLKIQGMEIDSTSLNKGIDVYVTHVKHRKNFVSLSIMPPSSKRTKENTKTQKQQNEGQETINGTIVSIDQKSIHPIYVKLKSKLVKISIFTGIKPAALGNLPIIRDLKSQFEVGQQVRVFRKGKQYYLYPPEQLSDKNLRICRVVSQKDAFLRLQVGKSEFKSCHISDVTDLILPYPFAEVSVGEYHIGRVLSNGMICLRDSVVMNGIPKNMMECSTKYSAEEKRGDYRNRILTVGSAGLKTGMVVFGYVKNFTERGCFVSVSNDFDVRIEISELSDQYISDKAKFYPLNKIMLMMLTSEKVKHNDPTKRFFDASARESIVKMGYPLNEEALMTGLTVEGNVTGYTKGKVLVKLDGSKFTGIMHPNEVEGLDPEEPIEKSMKLGTHYKMKIIEYSNDGKKLIRLSTLPKYFKKYPGVELNFEQDPRVVNLWQNYQQMLKEEPPAATLIEEAIDMDNDEDEYERIKKLLAQQEQGENVDVDGDGDVMDVEEQNGMGEGQVQVQEQLEDEQEEEYEEGEGEDDEMQSEEPEEQNNINNKINPTVETLPQQEVQRRLAQFREMNQSSQIYQSIILANDSSESHIQYISAMVSNKDATPEQIREQFIKSISMLESIKDKENMWVAWLNMELILGDFMGVVKKAIESGVGIPIYSRIIEILRQQENWDIAFQMAKKMLKKFNKDIKSYNTILKHLVLEQINNHGKQRMTLKEILRRASQCLKSKDLITLESQYSKILYEEKQPEKARTVFEGILANHPKRTDLWSMYVDLEVKHGNIDKAREILERSLTLNLKKKKMVSILKKYYQIEEAHGSKKSAAEILERAKRIAAEYAEEANDNEDSEEQN